MILVVFFTFYRTFFPTCSFLFLFFKSLSSLFFNSGLPVSLLLLAYTTKICTTTMVAIAMIIAADTCHPKSNPVVNIPKVAVLRIAFDIFPSSSTIFTGLLRQYANKLFSRTLFWSSSSTSTLSAFINLHNSGL